MISTKVESDIAPLPQLRNYHTSDCRTQLCYIMATDLGKTVVGNLTDLPPTESSTTCTPLGLVPGSSETGGGNHGEGGRFICWGRGSSWSGSRRPCGRRARARGRRRGAAWRRWARTPPARAAAAARCWAGW